MHTGEHLVATLFEVGRPGQIDQQRQRLAGDAVFAVVDVEIADADGELPAATRIVGEELAKMGVSDLIVMSAQGVPCRGSGDVGDWRGGHGSTLMPWSGVDQSRCLRRAFSYRARRHSPFVAVSTGSAMRACALAASAPAEAADRRPAPAADQAAWPAMAHASTPRCGFRHPGS